MSDNSYRYLDDLDGDALRAEIIRLARTDGIREAFRSAISICRDSKAPAQARSNAQRTLLTIGGLLDHRDRGDDAKKDPAEMDGVELQAEVERIMREGRERSTVRRLTAGASAFD